MVRSLIYVTLRHLGLNNTVDYQKNELLPFTPIQTGMHVISPQKTIDTFVVNGKSRPMARFLDSSNTKIKTFHDPFTPPPSTNLVIQFQGSPPFQTLIQNSDTSELQNLTNINQEKTFIPISSPGSFRILSVSDHYCQGSPQLPNTITVLPVEPPTLTLSYTPIEEACVGAIGAQVNMTFSGEPPFWVDYIIEMHDINTQSLIRRDVETIQSDKPRHYVKFEPHEPGNYSYVFQKVNCSILL